MFVHPLYANIGILEEPPAQYSRIKVSTFFLSKSPTKGMPVGRVPSRLSNAPLRMEPCRRMEEPRMPLSPVLQGDQEQCYQLLPTPDIDTSIAQCLIKIRKTKWRYPCRTDAAGYVLTTFGNLHGAIELFQESKSDLVLVRFVFKRCCPAVQPNKMTTRALFQPENAAYCGSSSALIKGTETWCHSSPALEQTACHERPRL